MSTLAALAAVMITFIYPAFGLPAIIIAVNLHMWRRHLEVKREAWARAEERRHREAMKAARYFR